MNVIIAKGIGSKPIGEWLALCMVSAESYSVTNLGSSVYGLFIVIGGLLSTFF